jgi:hypothetical protein
VGAYCSEGTTTPTKCPSGTYKSDTGGDSSSDCMVCPSGSYCTLGAIIPTHCPAGTYNLLTGRADLTSCQECPLGSYCVEGTTIPANCQAGTYRNATMAKSVQECTPCPPGGFCLEKSTVPTACREGTYRDLTMGTRPSDCMICQSGTFSMETGRTAPCDLCEANQYCTSPTSKRQCPLNTWSNPGAYSQFNCRCDAGFVCSYFKKIDAVINLNVSLYDFQNNVGNIQTDFISALANAGGVLPSNVIINGVSLTKNRRGMTEGIEIHSTVVGTVHMQGLEKVLEKLGHQHAKARWSEHARLQAKKDRDKSFASKM